MTLRSTSDALFAIYGLEPLPPVPPLPPVDYVTNYPARVNEYALTAQEREWMRVAMRAEEEPTALPTHTRCVL